MYDALSDDYDRFVNWPGRLALELPFIEQQLERLPVSHPGQVQVLDAATGTGMHAIALARKGYPVAGADLSAAMIARSRTNAAAAGVEVRFEAAGFGALEHVFGASSVDALLCLGNSLPHALSEAELSQALSDFAACLRPGGMLLVQNRNFDAVLGRRERWMEPQAHVEGSSERLFLRFYDFDPDGLITFNMIVLRREGGQPWQQQVSAARLRPLLRSDLLACSSSAGFERIQFFGNLQGAAFEPLSSGNLVMLAYKAPNSR